MSLTRGAGACRPLDALREPRSSTGVTAHRLRPDDPLGPGAEFRSQFPSLANLVWVNTPSVAPAADPVAEALKRAIRRWQRGEASANDHEKDIDACRALIAALIGQPKRSVALVGSLAEAASTVAASIAHGRVVVAAQEFRSNLFPWLALRDRGIDVRVVPARGGLVADEDLLAAIQPGTTLVAVSAVTSWDGQRRNLEAIVSTAHTAGARVFANLTQAAGVLRFDFGHDPPDYLAGHAYKWLLAPRGSGWLSVRDDLLDDVGPLIPSWRTPAEPRRRYFGGPYEQALDATKLDSPPAWLSWAGARAGLELIARLDAHEAERHCVALASSYGSQVARLGLEPVAPVTSQIVVARSDRAHRLVATLRERGIVAAALQNRLRVGFHAFNTSDDLDAILRTLREQIGPTRRSASATARTATASTATRGHATRADPMAPSGPDRAQLRVAVLAAVGVAVLLALFASSLLKAQTDPEPHGLPVGVAGPSAATAVLSSGIERAHPGAFALRRYPDEAAARRAILGQKISGALVPGPQDLTVLTAGADGPVAAAAITQAGRAAAQADDRAMTTTDVRPLVRGDPRGLAFNLMMLPLVITAIAAAVLVDRAAPRLGAWTRASVLAGFALTGGLVAALIARLWLGVVPGPFLGAAGLATLLLLAITLPTHAFLAVAGPPGIGIAVLVFLIAGNVGSGAAAGLALLGAASRRRPTRDAPG
jgi:selenocysteine lyase/cysteine desulfurase